MLKGYYDLIAPRYDQEISEMDKLSIFPYDGYSNLLTLTAEYIIEHSRSESVKVLDLGVGTAELYTKFIPDRIELSGIDFSKPMLEIAKLKIPDGSFYEYDFLNGLPDGLPENRFDFIVSTYTIHHMSLDALIDLIHHYLRYLTPFGKIVLADVLFLDDISKKQAYEQNLDSWDHDHHYHVYNQLVSKMKNHLSMSFLEVSESSGIIVIENYHEYALQYEDNLVKYKSNTTKWKSTRHPVKSE